mmetsp:Transcript_26294/g.83533  ORF Transcript_26294/g.83533 Transcript_26294/m.83533 type:complete len:478 (-) Transcript_26294:145-1578(-)
MLARPRDGDADKRTLHDLDGDVEQLRHDPEGGGLDFAQLHPHAADLDLPVGAAEVLQPSARVAAAQVAGAVEQPRAVRVEHELLRGELGPVQVAVRDLDAADADLAALAGRDRRRWVRRVQHVDGHAGVALEADRVSVRDRVVLGEALVVGDLDRRLGGPVQVDERQRAAERSGELGAMREEERLPRARDLAQVREVAGRDKVEEEREDRGHKVRDGDALLAHHPVDSVEVEVRSIGEDGGGAALEEGDPHLCDRAVEGGGCLVDEDVAVREREQPCAPAKPVPHAGGRDEAALRLAGGAGGVHDIHHFRRRPRHRQPRLAHLGEAALREGLEGGATDLREGGVEHSPALVHHSGERAPEREGEVDGDDGGDAGLLEDGDLARRWPRRVELHKSRTGLEARQLREQQRRRAGEDDAGGVRAGEQGVGELRGGSQLGRERGRLLVQLDETHRLSAACAAPDEGRAFGDGCRSAAGSGS